MRLRPPRLRPLLCGAALAAAGTIVLLVAMRQGVVPSNPKWVAAAAAAVLLLGFVALLVSVTRRSVAGALFSVGLLLVYGAGMANFFFSLQGYALLTEFDSVSLADSAQLQEFHGGPFSNLAEMDVRLQLEKLELLPAGSGFVPQSRIRVVRKGEKVRVLSVSQSQSASHGTLRFIQGAFGFAPRIVVTRNGEAIFDRYVPFTTRRATGGGVSFEETFQIASENLTVRSALDLTSLDESMRGHARLGVAVSRQGHELGRGELSMGRFAKLSDGTHIGYAGLKRWSEIDISRRTYGPIVISGVVAIVLSALVAPFTKRPV